MPPPVPPRIGRYEIIQVMPSGGMADLYLAQDPRIGGRKVVIKMLREGLDSDELRQRFKREANVLGSLSHLNLVTIFDVGDDEERPFIAMEYVQGQTLAEVIAERGSWSLAHILKLMEELCAGLVYAHRAGVVHRDVKPANLMVDQDGVLKILDFGIARQGSSSTLTGTVIGTLNYMAPEQMAGQQVDARADIFAAGAVFYELLSSRRAFPGELPGIVPVILEAQCPPLAEVMPDLDEDVVAIVDRCLRKDPDDRYADMAAVRRALSKVRQRVAVDEQRQIRAHRDAAEKAVDQEEFDTALAECEKGLALDPDARSLLELRDRAQSMRRGKEVREHVARGKALLGQGSLTGAGAAVERALKVDASATQALALREAIEAARSSRAEAQEKAGQAAGFLDRANQFLRAGSEAEALEWIGRALELDRKHGVALALKARVEGAISARKRAEQDARRDAEQRAKREAEVRAERAAEDEKERVAEERRRRKELADAEAETLAEQARTKFRAGRVGEAILLLEHHEPAHPVVTKALSELRAEIRPSGDQEEPDEPTLPVGSTVLLDPVSGRLPTPTPQPPPPPPPEPPEPPKAALDEGRTVLIGKVAEADLPPGPEAPTGPDVPTSFQGLPEAPWKLIGAIAAAVLVVAIGITMLVGGSGDPVVDTDGDGVADAADRCAATPAGTAVDSFGCAAAVVAGGPDPVAGDGDADGVPDAADNCPGTAAGATVDASGCAVAAPPPPPPPADTDGDGVLDSADQCANTPAGTSVNTSGCPAATPPPPPSPPDTDRDGVVNDDDRCGRTPPNTRVDSLGCPAPPTSPALRDVWTSPIDQRQMRWVRPGTFQMGSPADDPLRGSSEQDQHEEQIAGGFWLDATEVTNVAYRQFVLDRPAWGKGAPGAQQANSDYLIHWTGPSTIPAGVDRQPVTWVSYHAAEAYCTWAGKRLPTEAEWEYAARAGRRTAYWWGGDMDAEFANMSSSLLNVDRARPPSAAHPWGFLDILGNAYEWTQGGWLRGGAFNRREAALRLASRVRQTDLAFANVDYGVRCAK